MKEYMLSKHDNIHKDPNRKSFLYYGIDIMPDQLESGVRREFGNDGIMVMIEIMRNILQNELYYFDNTKRHSRIVSMTAGVTQSFFNKIVESLVEVGFFNNELKEKYNILTSFNIQENVFLTVAKKRKYSKIVKEFWLLSEIDPHDDTFLLFSISEECKMLSSGKERQGAASITNSDINDLSFETATYYNKVKGKERESKVKEHSSKKEKKENSFSEAEGTLLVCIDDKNQKNPPPKKENFIFLIPNIETVIVELKKVCKSNNINLQESVITDEAIKFLNFYTKSDWRYNKTGNKINRWQDVTKPWIVNGITSGMIEIETESIDLEIISKDIGNNYDNSIF